MLILMLLCLRRTALYLCIVLCFALSLFFLCMYAHFMYVHCTRIQRVHAAVHSYSCICLLHSVACSLGVIVYYYRCTCVYLSWYGYRVYSRAEFQPTGHIRGSGGCYPPQDFLDCTPQMAVYCFSEMLTATATSAKL